MPAFVLEVLTRIELTHKVLSHYPGEKGWVVGGCTPMIWQGVEVQAYKVVFDSDLIAGHYVPLMVYRTEMQPDYTGWTLSRQKQSWKEFSEAVQWMYTPPPLGE